MKARKVPICPTCKVVNKKEVHKRNGSTFVGDTFSHYKSIPCNCIHEKPKEEIDTWLEGLSFVKVNNSMWRKGNITLQSAFSHSGETIFEKILNTKYGFRVWVDKEFHSFVTTQNQLEDIINKGEQ